MSKKQLIGIALLVLIILILFGVTYGFVGKIPFLSGLIPSPTPALVPSGSQGSVKVSNFGDGGYFYSVNGVFTEAPYYQGDSLRTEFVIDGDPTKRNFLIILTSRGGKMNVGTITGDLEGTNSTAWVLTPTEELEKKIKEGHKGQLRFVYQKGYQLTPYDQQTVTLLSQIAKGESASTDQFILVPTMIGVVE